MKEIKIKAYRILIDDFQNRTQARVIVSAKSKEEALEIFNNWLLYKGYTCKLYSINQVRSERYARFMSSDYYTAQCILMEQLKRKYRGEQG